MFLYVRNQFNPEPEYALTPKLSDEGTRYIEYLGAPMYVLPRSVDDFRKRKSSKYWYNISRAESKFKEECGPLEFKVLQTRSEIEPWVQAVYELFKKRWSESYSSSTWLYADGFAKYSDALLALADKGEASLAILVSGENLLAFSYNLHGDDVLYFYQHAAVNDPKYHKYSLGKVFLIHLLNVTIEESRFRIFDFMVGEASYKMEWANCIQKVYFCMERRDYSNFFQYYMSVFKNWTRIQFVRSPVIKEFVRGLLVKFRGVSA